MRLYDVKVITLKKGIIKVDWVLFINLGRGSFVDGKLSN
jgi:hypothetical protein